MNSIIQSQGIHHITLNGADRKTSINFWQNILGMKLIFEQPNLDDLSINHYILTVVMEEQLLFSLVKIENQLNLKIIMNLGPFIMLLYG